MLYFGFALSSGMFSDLVQDIKREIIPLDVAVSDLEDAKMLGCFGGLEVCLNPSHTSTVEALQGLHPFFKNLEIPTNPQKVNVGIGDRFIVLQINGLPRLTDRHHYTPEEVAKATFTWVRYICW